MFLAELFLGGIGPRPHLTETLISGFFPLRGGPNSKKTGTHSGLKGSKPKNNSQGLRLVPFFVKLPHESPHKI